MAIRLLNYDNDFDLLEKFVSNLTFRKFSHWIKVTPSGVNQYLLNSIKILSLKQTVSINIINNEILGLLGYNILDWDTSHFGFKCVNIDFLLIKLNINEIAKQHAIKDLLLEYLQTSKKLKVKFTSISVDSWDTSTCTILQEFKFKFILTWINGFLLPGIKSIELDAEFIVELINPNEILLFQNMSADNYFTGGRFYFDSNFNKSSIKKLYSSTVLSSYQNNDILLVCRISGKPVGLFICRKIQKYTEFDNLKVAPLRFLIIDPNYRETMVAKNFFLQTIRYLQKESDLITTGLEVHNMPSLNLHQQMGFKFNYTHTVFHLWNY